MRIIPLLLVLLLLANTDASAAERLGRDVTTAGLAGSFVRPDGSGPAKAVLMIAGSGPTDRNGNSRLGVDANYLEMLAGHLAGANIASLRYDKRGVGGSKALVTSEATLRFSDFVGDAATWRNWLHGQPGISCIFLLGHSEGGLIATRVAEKSEPAGLILVMSPGLTFGAVLNTQLSTVPMSKTLRNEALSTLKTLESGKQVAKVDPKLDNIFRPSVQPYLLSILNIDPAQALARLTTPVLLISGGYDLQVNAADFEALRQARPDAQVIRIPKMNHVMKDVTGDRKANLAAYRNPDLPLSPELAAAVTKFITTTPCPTGNR
jgi:pimeloyl-ACP methyl ester carboxylesterase